MLENSVLGSKRVLGRVHRLLFLLKTEGLNPVLARIFRKLYFKLASPSLLAESHPPALEVPLSANPTYQQWLNKKFPRETDLAKMAETLKVFRYQPTISVLMPVFNTPETFLREAIASVIDQIYPYWELCIADDASTQPHVKEILAEYAAQDPRIKVVFRSENGHISHSSNSALEIATGEFVALLDHDDLLTPDALYEVALLLNQHPKADMIYSDENKLNEQGQLIEPAFKPDWCPDSFLSRMYTCHLGVYRRSLLNQIGGFRVGYEGSQDYDLVLRFTEKTNQVFHIPKVLYCWRIHPESTATGEEGVKPYAYIAAQKALEESIERRGEPGKVLDAPGFLGIYHVRYQLPEQYLVSIIIPVTSEHQTFIKNCITSIFTKSTYPNYEVIVVSDRTVSQDTNRLLAQWQAKEPTKFKHHQLSKPCSSSSLSRYGTRQAQGSYLLFLNANTAVITPDWIGAMLEQAQRQSIGAVGALLRYDDDTIQHAGLIVGIRDAVGCNHKYLPATASGYMFQIQAINNFSAVSGACLMCKREVYEQIGGFDEKLTHQYYDVDLCLKMVEQGYRNIYLPHVALYHYESKEEKVCEPDLAYFRAKWQSFIKHDPCYSPHLTREYEDYRL
ncbi:glycosyltransferase [Trichocoleus sp. FACHB-591]|uniref:glycosyltransferase family 2 protein n=1 Tax=Trichocoleus sp. FACHB-591 TaxID=2692872 RepID=UPI0016885AEB|nr:glycosyltransferase [Trichocoleus sp. FACHB-591]MBD2094889.1 glycosyltransferase [Trichocoleus sp. FACHB-591]